jgi:hypothetical protein
MPRFLAYMPDYPNVLHKRFAVREQHLAEAKLEKDAGRQRESCLTSSSLLVEMPHHLLLYPTLFFRWYPC